MIVEEDRVVITVTEALLEGSPEVQRLEINSKFEFDIRVILSTETDRSSLRSELMCKSEISVWVDVPVIFRAMFPKPLIEQTGNAVIFASLNIIQVRLPPQTPCPLSSSLTMQPPQADFFCLESTRRMHSYRALLMITRDGQRTGNTESSANP